MTGPWIFMGDFNAILHGDDKANGNVVQESEIKDFKEFLENTGLCELKTVGREYTWTNGHVFSRIDKALINPIWMTTMSQLEVEILDPGCSDHSPLVIDFYEPDRKKPRAFKFLNHLVHHYSFMDSVQRGWDKPVFGDHMKQVWGMLKNVKGEMKNLHTKEFSNVEQRIRDTRKQLADIQEQMRDLRQESNLFDTEWEIKNELEKWTLVQKRIYKQKSRIKWLQLGDSNSAYFLLT